MMLSDDQHRRQLVKQKNEDAQTLLDLFQEVHRNLYQALARTTLTYFSSSIWRISAPFARGC